MPQMGLWPFIGRTMVEAAHGVKVLKLSPQNADATPRGRCCVLFGWRHLTKA
jgi:hypothetical protein